MMTMRCVFVRHRKNHFLPHEVASRTCPYVPSFTNNSIPIHDCLDFIIYIINIFGYRHPKCSMYNTQPRGWSWYYQCATTISFHMPSLTIHIQFTVWPILSQHTGMHCRIHIRLASLSSVHTTPAPEWCVCACAICVAAGPYPETRCMDKLRTFMWRALPHSYPRYRFIQYPI